MDRSINIFILLYLIIINVLSPVRGEHNVAAGKTTNQSSDYIYYNSSLAVDGNTDSNFNKRTCSHTHNYDTNWWCVDLERDVDFQNIKIYNRNAHQERLQGFEIRVSSNGKCNYNGYQQSTVCYKDTSTTLQDIYNINSCNQSPVQFNGRYVYISVENPRDYNRYKYLTLCEVEIFEEHEVKSTPSDVECGSNCKDGCDSNGTCNNCTTGLYGDKCETPCPTNCDGGCQQDDGYCINGCRPGYRNCNIQCESNCKDGCDSNGICNNCITGYYGNKCNTLCPINCNGGCRQSDGYCNKGCRPGYRNCNIQCGNNCQDGCDSTGICNDCITVYYGNKCDTPCPINCNGGCRQSDGYCNKGCKPGYRGNTCNTQCESNCNLCRQTDGICTECKSEYWSYYCRKSCRNCNNGCQKSSGNCIGGCKKSYWGMKCNNNCNKCNQGCQQDNGYCNSGGCISGYYGDKCDEKCPTNCNGECTQNNGDCEECKDGYWDIKCKKQCPTNCRQVKCDKNNGYCGECKNYYWGDKCEKQCSANCKYHISTTCKKTNGKCSSGCKDTWYGDTCNNKCSSNCTQSKCYKSQSGPATCTTGCIDGYKGSYCQDTCLDNCISCNSTQCTRCNTGLYGNQCQTKCNDNCIHGCGQDTGRCTSCKDRYYGNECTEKCPISCPGNCKQDSGHCESCKSGSFGNYCNEKCSTGCLPAKDQSTCDRNGRCSVGCINGRYGNKCDGKCSNGCKNGTCNINDGSCSVGCINGRYGDVCDGKCSTGCQNGTCIRKDGSCISGCISGKSGRNCTEDCSKNCTICSQHDNKDCSQCYDGYYGQSCNQPCSKTCQSQDNKPVCNITNGYCTIGCIKGYSGNDCNKNCSSNCSQKTCHQTNGFCTYGCVAGKEGDTCSEDCPNGTYGLRCNSTCGNCNNQTMCHIVTGTCGLMGCQAGFQGPTCKEVIEEIASSSITAVIVTLAVVIVAVIGIVLIIRRIRQENGLRSVRRNDIMLSNRQRVPEDDTLQYNSLNGDSSANNVDLASVNNEDNQQNIYQNIAILNSTPSTRIDLPDLWNYSQEKLDQLKEQYQKLPKGLCRPHAICLNEINVLKNRYKNVCAFDDTRVKLKPIDNDPNSDYINACYITMYGKSSKYIASQGPIEVNMEEFIRMIWDVDTSKIVMVTNLYENAIEKCKQYWPDVDKTQKFGQISIKLIKEDVYTHFTIRELQISKAKSGTRIFRQYHYTSWPDKGVPSDIASLVEFRNKVNKSPSKRSGPMIVHCSAGIGRTGTFLALDYLIQQAQAENSVDIFSCVSQMRQERVNMVQTVNQYIFLHDALTVWYITDGTTTSVTNYPQVYNQLLQQDTHNNTSQLQLKYQWMNMISCKIDKDGYSEALQPENKVKNRDQHVLPSNSARLMLMRSAYENSSDYINAVYLPSYKKKRGYIATQTPLPNTVEDFWLMVLNSETKVVISLDDKKAKNIGEYLPKTEMKCGEMILKRGKEDKTSYGYYDINSFQITHETDNITRTVKVYQCHFWKGQNKLPDSSMSIFTLLEEISRINDSGPLVVSCLNGVNKSGLLCVLAAILERLTIEKDVNIVQTILQLRISRPEIINSFEQFKFCFDAVGVYLDHFWNYANI